jgi:hypothetical protein
MKSVDITSCCRLPYRKTQETVPWLKPFESGTIHYKSTIE